MNLRLLNAEVACFYLQALVQREAISGEQKQTLFLRSGRNVLSQGKDLQVAGKGTGTFSVGTDSCSAGCREKLGAGSWGAWGSFLGGLCT